MKIFLTLVLVSLVVGLASCKPAAPREEAEMEETQVVPAEPQSQRPLFMAHYMAWYQTPEESGFWGWHWDMDHFDPKQVDENGRPQIASHYMPLTGPYDSKDRAVLEYQTLLMKLSGIDGVIVDWYGASNYADYGVINQSTMILFEALQKAGLLLAVCYEDQAVKHMVEGHKLDEAAVYTQGQADLKYLQDTWFNKPEYLKFEGRPVLFNFGPQYFVNAADWETLFASLATRPVLVTLDQHFVASAVGTFPWPPMQSAQNGVLSPGAVESYLDGFYKKAQNYQYVVGGAFPGFHDIYQEAGVSSSYGYLDAQDGKTFEMTLQKAVAAQPDVIQLITWNDYGEGTIIEPTEEFGYHYLEMIQAAQEGLGNDSFGFTAEDLRLPLRLYQLRQQYPDAQTQTQLDAAYDLLLGGETSKAAENLNSYP